MKCIINSETKKVSRLNNKVARNLVRTNRLFSFVPKWMYKEQEGKTYNGQQHTPVSPA